MNNNNNHLRAYGFMTVVALCWGANAVIGRLAVGELSPMALVSLRWLGVLILLALFAQQAIRDSWPILRKHLLFVAVMGTMGFSAFNVLYYIAAHYTTAVNIGILQGSIPVFVLLAMFIIYHNRTNYLQITGVVVTMLGVAVVAAGGDLARLAALSINFGDLLMLAACVCYSVYAVGLRKRPATSALGLFAALAVAAFISSLPLFAIESALGQLQWPTATGWGLVVLAALFPSFLAQTLFIQSVTLIGPARAGVFVNLVPIFASILAVTFLNERFESFHALALVLVLGGIWLSERSN